MSAFSNVTIEGVNALLGPGNMVTIHKRGSVAIEGVHYIENDRKPAGTEILGHYRGNVAIEGGH